MFVTRNLLKLLSNLKYKASSAKRFWKKKLMTFSFYCVLALCVLSNLILTTLGERHSLFSFYSQTNKQKTGYERISNIAQLIHLINVMGFYQILLRPNRDEKYVTKSKYFKGKCNRREVRVKNHGEITMRIALEKGFEGWVGSRQREEEELVEYRA